MLIDLRKKYPKMEFSTIIKKGNKKMAGYQFIHVETYAREASKQKAGSLSVRDVIAEAGREPGNCPHVEEPQAPEILHGSLEDAERSANEWAEQATDDKGRKLRKDGHCLLAGVISLPKEMESEWPEFSKLSLKYLKQKYGDRLKAVVGHHDESHPHMHFYCVARPGESFSSIHEGQKAAKKVKKEGKKKGEQNTAYIQAMRGFQDDFYLKVGVRAGLVRFGPKRTRKTRAQWQADKKQAEADAMRLNLLENSKKVAETGFKQGYEQGKMQAEKEAKAPVKKFTNKAKGFVRGVVEGWNTLTQAEKDAQRALKADDIRRAEEQARKEAEFKRKEVELRAAAEERLKNEKLKREQAEDALDFVLKVGGPELLLAVQQASKERKQAPQEAVAKNAVGNKAKLVDVKNKNLP